MHNRFGGLIRRPRWMVAGLAALFIAFLAVTNADHESRADAISLGARPAVLANGRGIAVAGGVLAVPTNDGARSAAYKLQPQRWSTTVLKRIRASGFGFIRLVITIMPVVTDDDDARKRAVDWLSARVDEARAQGLNVSVVYGFWPTDKGVVQDKVIPDPRWRARILRGETEIAAMLQTKPAGSVAVELHGEPPCEPAAGPNSWAAIQLATWQRIRQVAPTLPLILTGCKARPDTLIALDPAPYRNDRNIIWAFHYYDFFTGQDAWGLRAIPFPAKPELADSTLALRRFDPNGVLRDNMWLSGQLRKYLLNDKGSATIAASLDTVSDWAARNHIPARSIVLSEFAPLIRNLPENAAIRPDQLRWITAVRQEADRRGFSSAYWTVSPDDMNYDSATSFLRPDTLKALGVSP